MATATAQKLSTSELGEILSRYEPLVGMTDAGALLGIHPPNVKRYRDRLTVVPVGKSGKLYFVSELKQLKKELARERRARNGKR